MTTIDQVPNLNRLIWTHCRNAEGGPAEEWAIGETDDFAKEGVEFMIENYPPDSEQLDQWLQSSDNFAKALEFLGFSHRYRDIMLPLLRWLSEIVY